MTTRGKEGLTSWGQETTRVPVDVISKLKGRRGLRAIPVLWFKTGSSNSFYHTLKVLYKNFSPRPERSTEEGETTDLAFLVPSSGSSVGPSTFGVWFLQSVALFSDPGTGTSVEGGVGPDRRNWGKYTLFIWKLNAFGLSFKMLKKSVCQLTFGLSMWLE